MTRATGPGADPEGDAPAGSRARGRLLVLGGAGPESLAQPVLEARFTAAGPVDVAPLGEDGPPTGGYRTVALVLSPAADGWDLLDLLHRAVAWLAGLPGGAPEPATTPLEGRRVVVVGPPALTAHRSIQAEVERTGALCLPPDLRRPVETSSPAPGWPDEAPNQRLGGHLAEWGLRGRADAEALHAVLGAAPADPFPDATALLDLLRREVPGLRRPDRADEDPGLADDLRWLAAAVAVAVRMHRVHPPDDVPEYRLRRSRSR